VAQEVIAPLPLEVTLESITINEGNDGQIAIKVEGGVEPYDITWYLNDEVIGSGAEISELAEGIYRAVIIDANGCVFETSDFLLSPTSIAELEPSELSVYPNPARSSFVIEFIGNYTLESIKVISATGQDVSKLVRFVEDGGQISGYNEGLVSGLYYLEVSENGERVPLVILGEAD